LHFTLRHCDVQKVRLIPQASRALYPKLITKPFAVSSCSLLDAFCLRSPEIPDGDHIAYQHKNYDNQRPQHAPYALIPRRCILPISKDLHAVQEPQDVRQASEKPAGDNTYRGEEQFCLSLFCHRRHVVQSDALASQEIKLHSPGNM